MSETGKYVETKISGYLVEEMGVSEYKPVI